MKTKKPAKEDLRKLYLPRLQRAIRTAYDVDEEFKLLNLGIANKNDPDYLAYREYISKLIIEFNKEVDKHYERSNAD